MIQCTLCHNTFSIPREELQLLHDLAPVIAGQKYFFPSPTVCPPCRRENRMLFKNQRHLYKRTCDFSGKPIISCYSSDSDMTVYDATIWWSDVWDPMEFGQDINWEIPFFTQFEKLFYRVPVFHIAVTGNEGCDYVNGCANCKNCYLAFNMDYCENVLYSQDMKHNKDCMDCESTEHSELCYASSRLRNCYHVLYGEQSINCSFCAFIVDCQSVKNCIGCIGIQHSEYMVLNKQVSKEEFERVQETLKTPAGLMAMSEQFALLRSSFSGATFFGANNEDCSGNNLFHVKRAYDCFDSENLENCFHCTYVFQARNCMDFDVFGDFSEWIYNCESTGINCSNIACCLFCFSDCANLLYCNLCVGCQNCFGCSGLRNKQYCIFNKQYNKEEYEILVVRLIALMKEHREWGKYFPGSMSPFAFNMLASEYMPETRSEVLNRGWKWDDSIMDWNNLPSSIVSYGTIPVHQESIPDLQSTVLFCPISGKQFKMNPYELGFYLKMGLPANTLHPDIRHAIRRQQQSSYKEILRPRI